MTRYADSRVKYLRLALQEAFRAGDKAATKRLTAKLAQLIGGVGAPTTQDRVH